MESKDHILQTRAQALAQPISDHGKRQTAHRYLEFLLGTEHYALTVDHLVEVYPIKILTPLPCVPAFIIGIANYRGQILVINDLHQLLGLPRPRELEAEIKVIVLQDERLTIGLLAARILGIIDLDKADVSPVPVAISASDTGYVQGLGPNHLILLESARILSDPRLIVKEEN